VLSVSIHPDAVQEYVAAFRWYHERSPGVALRFETNAEQALMFVASHPEAPPLCDEVHRYRKIRRYPYGLVYRIVGQTVFVVAIAHDRQLPGFWRDRT
jgi:plasmid stabilization system protein ParE